MPTYSFRNKETGEEFDTLLKMSELDEFKSKNPQLEQFLSSPPKIVSMVGTLHSKTSDGFTDVLKKIKSGSGANNTIRTK
jgi:hypothetical protein